MQTQTRPRLAASPQQANAGTIAALLAPQVERFTASGTHDIEKTKVIADATAGNVTISLQSGSKWPHYMPYTFQKVGATNTVTLDCDGSEEIDGSGTLVLTDDGEMAVFYWDPVDETFRKGAPSTLPAGAAAVDGSNVTGQDAVDFLAAIGGADDSNTVHKDDVHMTGAVRLDLDSGNSDEVRFVMGFAGAFTRIRGVNWGATIATGDAIVTASIGGTPVTGGALAWEVNDTAGTAKTSVCSAANVFAAGDIITLAVTGTNDAAAFGGVTLEYTRS